jgi:hypothetical protein
MASAAKPSSRRVIGGFGKSRRKQSRDDRPQLDAFGSRSP